MFPLLSHEASLKLIGMLGVRAVDVKLFSGRSHVQPEDVAADVEGAATVLRTRLDAAGGLAVADVFLQTGPEFGMSAANTPDRTARARSRRLFGAAVELAERLHCRHLTGLPGIWHPGVDPAADWDRAVTEASWRVRTAGDAGIAYAVEAHVGSLVPTPQSALRLIENVAGLSLTLDYGHFACDGSPDDDIHPLLEHASHLHVRGAAQDHLQTPVADSQVDFTEVARRLDQRGYTGWVCLEYVWVDWQGCNRCDTVSETILLKRLMERVGG